jgi:stage III sporulation protein AH
MVVEQKINPVKNFFLKIGKRNLIIAGAVALIGAAVLLNFVMFGGVPKDGYSGYDEPSGLTGSTEGQMNASDTYFASAQVSRQRARDEAMEVLQGVIEDENSGEEAKATALADIAKMAEDMEAEANVETLVMSKGFEQCVAVISDNGISVVVDVPDTALTPAQIAQINTIVYEQTGITPDKTVIIEK